MQHLHSATLDSTKVYRATIKTATSQKQHQIVKH